MVITYIAVENLFSGHVLNQQYQFEAPVSAYDILPQRIKRYTESLNGNPQTLDYGKRDTVRISTIDLFGDDVLLARECFNSILNGQTFTMDPLGTIASPSGTLLTCVHHLDKFREARLSVTDWFQFSATYRILSGS